MENKIASLREIADLLNAKLLLRTTDRNKGEVIRQILESLSNPVDARTFNRWLEYNEKAKPGDEDYEPVHGKIRDVAEAALFLEIEPNTLLLRRAGDPLTPEDYAALSDIQHMLRELRRHYPGKASPVEMIRHAVRELLDMAEERHPNILLMERDKATGATALQPERLNAPAETQLPGPKAVAEKIRKKKPKKE